ncbi:MAG TPA: ABC transporter ATP-binding protein [Pirellulales bacterium]|nr:ABC transporter ATP-binding protein [Pirellulales bacterium]
MYSIKCHEVTKRFDRVEVLDRVCWQIEAGKVVGLLGGSGAGKTTLLRLLAGLTRCTSGNIIIDGPANGRWRIGMVFQSLALWPHLTALEHLRCVLFRHAVNDRRRRAEALLGELRLPARVWNHRPAQLSGGEAQRLALARALAVGPDLLLLDEPLAHLDPPLRTDMLELIRDCVSARRTTCIFVTHSWDEAAMVCERIAVLDGGRLVQEGTPSELHWHPVSEAVARWTGPCIELPRAWLRQGIIATRETSPPAIAPAGADTLLIRPQQLSAMASTQENGWTVIDVRPRAGGWSTTVARGRDKLSLFLPQPVFPGETIGIELRPPVSPADDG